MPADIPFFINWWGQLTAINISEVWQNASGEIYLYFVKLRTFLFVGSKNIQTMVKVVGGLIVGDCPVLFNHGQTIFKHQRRWAQQR